jgi:hypothetical protein
MSAPKRKQQRDDLAAVGPGAGESGDQRGKAGAVPVVRIGAKLEQRPDEGQRAVIERVFQADLAGARRATTVGKIRRIAKQRLECFEIAPLVHLMDCQRFVHGSRQIYGPGAVRSAGESCC